MKKTFLIIAVIAVIVIVPSSIHAKIVIDNFCTKQQDSVEVREVHLQRLKKIEVSDGIKVEIIFSSENKAVISSNYIDYVMVDRHAHRAKIYYFSYEKYTSLCKPKTTIKLYTRNIKQYIAKKGASIILTSPLKRRKVRLFLASGGTMEGALSVKKARIVMADRANAKLQINTKDLKIKAHSSAIATILGKANWSKVKAVKSCKIDLADMVAKKAKVEAYSSSSVKVKAMRLNAKASGSGNIAYQVPENVKLWHIKAKQKKGGRVVNLGE